MDKNLEHTNPIRVLQVFASMDRGGSETAIMNVYRNIDRQKVQFDFLVHTLEECDYDKEIESLGGRIFRIPRYSLKNHVKYLKLWSNFLNEHPEFRIIHGHYFTISSIYFSVAKKYNLLCIAHSHSEFRGSIFEKIKMRIFTYPLRYKADYLFACSKVAGISLYGKEAVKKNRLFVVNNAIEVEKFSFNITLREKTRNDLNIKDKFVIGHIGNFSKAKNYPFILDIFNVVLKQNKKAQLVLVGKNKNNPLIAQKVKEMGLSDYVTFTGVRVDVPDLLSAMDVFVFPSLYEGLGIVAVEAQAAGLHTIVSETIPYEAYVTDLIEREYLSSSPSQWADRILKYSDGYERGDTSKVIKLKGYDIYETARWIQDFYLTK